MLDPIVARKAGNLSPGETRALLEWSEQPGALAVLGMRVACRDLQCLLEIHWACQDAGWDSLSQWCAKQTLPCLRAIAQADARQTRRGL